MWIGICYATAFVLAAVSLLASCSCAVPSRSVCLRKNARLLPGPSVTIAVSLLLVAGIVWAVGFGAFYRSHWTGPFPGSIRYGAEDELLGYHLRLLVLCFATAGNMAVRLVIRRMSRARICATAGVGTALAAGVAFRLTVPRGGDDGVIVWALLGPLLFLALAVLVATSVITALVGERRQAPPA